MTFFRDIAPGVHRIEDAYTNWCLIEGDAGITIVDAGVPSSWDSLHDALQQLGRSPGDVRALVLTHAHFDHVGFAERARTELGIPVWVHGKDVELTKHPARYDHERWRVPYLLTQVRAMPIIAALARHRAFWPPPIGEVRRFGDVGELLVPGRPRIVASPGHTYGHCSLHLPDRDVLLVGDAFVMLDPYTGRRGPRLVARAATADVRRNRESLDALAATGAKIALTGHGEPWRDGVEAAVAAAKAAPVA